MGVFAGGMRGRLRSLRGLVCLVGLLALTGCVVVPCGDCVAFVPSEFCTRSLGNVDCWSDARHPRDQRPLADPYGLVPAPAQPVPPAPWPPPLVLSVGP
ncbi:MAG: hypothetical protein JO326_08860 [Acetobacteraceae bacterium]|nr:hypothetical protein [Acetobacteraceae bacterium]